MSAARLRALETARGRRIRQRRRRRLAAAAVVSLPGLTLVGTDLLRRSGHVARFDREHWWGYLATAAASLVLWGVLLYASSRPRGWLRAPAAGVLTVGFGLTYGVQNAFFSIYRAYLSHDTQIFARSYPKSLLGYLPLDEPIVLVHLALSVALAIAFVVLARTYIRPGRISRYVTPLLWLGVLAGVTQLPASYRVWQSTTPDIIYVHGMVDEVTERLRWSEHHPEVKVQRRTAPALPEVEARPAAPRNVLFVLQESLRQDITCNDYVPGAADSDPPACATPFSNRSAPRRTAFSQMRANASSTAISVATLWTGLSGHLSYDRLHSAPLLWDYANAAGIDTAYFTSQHVMFHNMRLFVQDAAIDRVTYATHLDTMAAFDEGASDALLTDHVIERWNELEEPFFAVVHYSNVHFPYVYDPEHAPFQPAAFTRESKDNELYFNYYKNVAYLSDMAVARLIDHVRETDEGERTVIVYTADHGEAFREHWQLGHTSSLYDEEILVPGWIDAPEGTLTDAERAAIEQKKDRPIWHLDLAPTLLDLLGLWRAEPLARWLDPMRGHPLTRQGAAVGPVPLTNCSWVWECAFRNWGMMQGHMKIQARQWDRRFHCFDLEADPAERIDLGEEACQPLPDIARATFGPMPAEAWPRGKDLLFGPAPTN